MAGGALSSENRSQGLNRRSLQARVGRLFFLQLAVISVAVVAMVFATAYIVTDVLSRAALEGEAAYFWQRYQADRAVPLPDTDNMIGYLSAGGRPPVPSVLAAHPPGFGSVRFEGRDSLLHVSERSGARLYLVFRQEKVDRLILYFGLGPGAVVLLLIYAMSWVIYRLSQPVFSPLIRLAERLESYRPDLQRPVALELDELRRGADTDTLVMIDALEAFARSLSSVALRERAFARDASHELRTPLAVMTASLDLLERNQQRENSDLQALKRIRGSLTQMQSLIESLLLLARDASLPLNPEGADIHGLIREQIEILRERAELHHNRVTLVDAAMVRLPVPERLFGIAFGNLLSNAINYTRDGEVTIRVDTNAVEIEDSGAGMTAEELGRVFEPFFRSESARGSGVSGHGLGLSIVQRIADRFGWVVRISSEPGRGTRIRMEFNGARQESGA